MFKFGFYINELIGYEKKKEIEVNSTVSLKETYEMRIADITSSFEIRIEDIKVLCETRVSDILKCCETRIADLTKSYEARIADYKDMIRELKAI